MCGKLRFILLFPKFDPPALFEPKYCRSPVRTSATKAIASRANAIVSPVAAGRPASAGFPDVPGVPIPRFVFGDPNTVAGLQDVASLAMTSDSFGNFYVATGVVGGSLCGSDGRTRARTLGPLVKSLRHFLDL